MRSRTQFLRADVVIVIAAYVVSRLLAYAAGVRFDASPLPSYWQYLEVDLLKTDLLRSLFHLHAQPPLFNLFLGAVLKMAGTAAPAVFAATYGTLGLVLAVSMPTLLRFLGVRRPVAIGASILLIVSPTMILYEHWLFYSFAVSVALVLAAVVLHAAVRTGRWALLLGFFGMVAGVALTRSTFHLLWLVGCVAAVMMFTRLPRRQVVTAAIIPVLAVVAVYTKNAVLFGGFSASSWAGMSLARMTVNRLDPEVGSRWVRDGTLSEIAPIPPFTPLGYYPDHWIEPAGEPPAGVPALDRRSKSNRYPNFNHRSVPRLAGAYLQDSWTVMRMQPRVYAGSIARAWLLFGLPPSEIKFVAGNRRSIEGWDRVYNRLTGQFGRGGPSSDESLRFEPGYVVTRVQWLWVVAVFGSFVVVVAGIPASLRSRDPSRSATALTLLFILGTVTWAAVVSNGMEIDENNRFRVMLEPLFFTLVAVATSVAWGRRRSGLG